MKKLILSTALLAATFLNSFAQYEGSYNMNISGDKIKEPIDMIITVKGDLSTLEMPQMKQNGFVKSITNRKDQTIVMLMDNKGSKMAMKQKAKNPDEMIKKSKSEPKVTQTGETKMIEGYKCEKWIIESDESVSECWMTNELGLTMVDMLGFMSGRNASAYARYFPEAYDKMKGISLETNITETKNSVKTKMLINNVKKFKVNDDVFSTEGYPMMEMPPMPGTSR